MKATIEIAAPAPPAPAKWKRQKVAVPGAPPGAAMYLESGGRFAIYRNAWGKWTIYDLRADTSVMTLGKLAGAKEFASKYAAELANRDEQEAATRSDEGGESGEDAGK